MGQRNTIVQLGLGGLAGGVDGWPVPGGTKHVLAGLFTCDGFDYYVRPTRRYGIWDVVKTASDGGPLSEYVVRRDSRSTTCDCFPGRKHLACRHKEMVEMFESGASCPQHLIERSLSVSTSWHGPLRLDEGARASTNKHSVDAVGAIDARDLLERARRLMRRT